ncbi:hypothetical protein AA313_de0209737 [Arthrobotrys entomopaga]|nr:hypothetical protein AA313_de0209737 [Arthrobotrys entomopaga]
MTASKSIKRFIVKDMLEREISANLEDQHRIETAIKLEFEVDADLNPETVWRFLACRVNDAYNNSTEIATGINMSTEQRNLVFRKLSDVLEGGKLKVVRFHDAYQYLGTRRRVCEAFKRGSSRIGFVARDGSRGNSLPTREKSISS